jgi:hypothetical protein
MTLGALHLHIPVSRARTPIIPVSGRSVIRGRGGGEVAGVSEGTALAMVPVRKRRRRRTGRLSRNTGTAGTCTSGCGARGGILWNLSRARCATPKTTCPMRASRPSETFERGLNRPNVGRNVGPDCNSPGDASISARVGCRAEARHRLFDRPAHHAVIEGHRPGRRHRQFSLNALQERWDGPCA